jgi:hypothetical protein
MPDTTEKPLQPSPEFTPARHPKPPHSSSDEELTSVHSLEYRSTTSSPSSTTAQNDNKQRQS